MEVHSRINLVVILRLPPLGLILSITCLPLCRFQKGNQPCFLDWCVCRRCFSVWQICWWNVNFILHPKVIIKFLFLFFFFFFGNVDQSVICYLTMGLYNRHSPSFVKIKSWPHAGWKFFFSWQYRKYWCHNSAYVTCVSNLLYEIELHGESIKFYNLVITVTCLFKSTREKIIQLKC